MLCEAGVACGLVTARCSSCRFLVSVALTVRPRSCFPGNPGSHPARLTAGSIGKLESPPQPPRECGIRGVQFPDIRNLRGDVLKLAGPLSLATDPRISQSCTPCRWFSFLFPTQKLALEGKTRLSQLPTQRCPVFGSSGNPGRFDDMAWSTFQQSCRLHVKQFRRCRAT